MICPKCGTQNVEEAQVCVSCGQVLTAAHPAGVPVQVKISRLAIASFILGILSIFTLGLTAIPATVLGILSLLAIEKSGGRLTGLASAIGQRPGSPTDSFLVHDLDGCGSDTSATGQ